MTPAVKRLVEIFGPRCGTPGLRTGRSRSGRLSRRPAGLAKAAARAVRAFATAVGSQIGSGSSSIREVSSVSKMLFARRGCLISGLIQHRSARAYHKRTVELYKYCKSEHMRALLDADTLMIGTVFGWRQIGNYGEMVMDSSDGRIRLPKSNLIFYDYRFISALEPQAHVEVDEENELRHFRMIEISTHDVYAFSAASTYSKQDHRKWFESEGYDACYRVMSARLFFRAISRSFVEATFALWNPILYYDDSHGNIVFEQGKAFHPALLKEQSGYGAQVEVRAIWTPKQLPITPKLLTVPGAHLYCCEHRVLS